MVHGDSMGNGKMFNWRLPEAKFLFLGRGLKVIILFGLIISKIVKIIPKVMKCTK